MPPKTDKPASTAEPRRSTRLSAAPPSKVEAKDEGKKRTADKPDSKAPAAKKAKPESKPASKPAPTSKGKPASTTKKTPASKAKKSEAIPEGDEDKANGDGDETEDKAEAEAEQPKAAEAEKEAEAPADADTEKPASKAGGKIKEGDVLPKGLKLEDEEGNEVDVGELAKDKGVVLFLYPKANTPGCTNQACGFRDNYAEIQKLGYDVYGLSADKPSPQKNWKTKHNMQYNLLCDPEYKLIKRLGSFSPPKQTKRSSFIFEKGGKLVKAHSAATPATDPKNCLEFIKSHK